MDSYAKDDGRDAVGGRAVGWLLVLAATAALTVGYLPSRQKSEVLGKEVEQCRMRLTTLKARIERLRQAREALAARDPETLQETIRERLRKGQEGEFILPRER